MILLREVRAEMAEPRMTFEDSIAMLDQALDHLGNRNDSKRREEGWTELGGGVWIPPGWVWTGEGDPSEAALGFQKKDDAVCNSSNSSTSQTEDEQGEASFQRRPEPETTAGQSMNTEDGEPAPPGCPARHPGESRDLRPESLGGSPQGSGLRRDDEFPPPTSKPPSPGILADEPTGAAA